MFVDASVLVAIIASEPDAVRYSQILEDPAHQGVITSSVSVFEAVLGVARAIGCTPLQSESLVNDLLGQLDIIVVAVEARHASLAARASERFGKGRHPAALNLGDCLAYAVATDRQLPLLFKGSDFSRTDIPSALALS